MTKFEFLSEGLISIANKYGCKPNFEGAEDEIVSIFGRYNKDMHKEVLALCSEVGIERKKVFACDDGIDIMLDGWLGTKGKHEYK